MLFVRQSCLLFDLIPSTLSFVSCPWCKFMINMGRGIYPSYSPHLLYLPCPSMGILPRPALPEGLSVVLHLSCHSSGYLSISSHITPSCAALESVSSLWSSMADSPGQPL